MIDCLVFSLCRTIIFDHAEIALHNYYGGREYWTVRKSMQFSDKLYVIAKEFKKNILKHNYMCAHLRRRDFLYGHPNDVPSIKETTRQIQEKLSFLNKIDTIYIATDAPKIGSQVCFLLNNFFFINVVYCFRI